MSFNLISNSSNSRDIFREKEVCSTCKNCEISKQCDKCGDGVCGHKHCHWSFPYKNNTNYILCVGCFNCIEKKLINYDHLLIYKFLKKHTIIQRRVSV